MGLTVTSSGQWHPSQILSAEGSAPGFPTRLRFTRSVDSNRREACEVMKILLLLSVVALIVSLARSKPDVARKVTPTPAPLIGPHVSRLPGTKLQPSGKIGD